MTKDFLSRLSPSERAYYGVDADGEPNGFAVDAGLDKIEAIVPAPSKEQYLEAGRAAVQYLRSLGITAWLDAVGRAADPGNLSKPGPTRRSHRTRGSVPRGEPA